MRLSAKLFTLLIVSCVAFMLNLHCCRSEPITYRNTIKSIKSDSYKRNSVLASDTIGHDELAYIAIQFVDFPELASTSLHLISSAYACSPQEIEIQENTFHYLHFIALDSIPNYAYPGDTIDSLFEYSTHPYPEPSNQTSKTVLDQKLSTEKTGLLNHSRVNLVPNFTSNRTYKLHFQVNLGLDDTTVITHDSHPITLIY